LVAKIARIFDSQWPDLVLTGDLDTRKSPHQLRICHAILRLGRDVALDDLLKTNDEDESTASAPNRPAHDLTTELVDNLAADVQPKTNTARVHCPRVLNETIELK
jgi:hypothetical protein